eukprot:m51a1_g7174 hypothetical protein (479) ;mRNA; r:69541-71392
MKLRSQGDASGGATGPRLAPLAREAPLSPPAGCPCALCTRPVLPRCLTCRSKPTWTASMRVVFKCLESLMPGTNFFSLRDDIYPFTESHWRLVCRCKPQRDNWKKSVQDTLSHSASFVSGATHFGQYGYWRLDDESDPWDPNSPVADDDGPDDDDDAPLPPASSPPRPHRTTGAYTDPDTALREALSALLDPPDDGVEPEPRLSGAVSEGGDDAMDEDLVLCETAGGHPGASPREPCEPSLCAGERPQWALKRPRVARKAGPGAGGTTTPPGLSEGREGPCGVESTPAVAGAPAVAVAAAGLGGPAGAGQGRGGAGGTGGTASPVPVTPFALSPLCSPLSPLASLAAVELLATGRVEASVPSAAPEAAERKPLGASADLPIKKRAAANWTARQRGPHAPARPRRQQELIERPLARCRSSDGAEDLAGQEELRGLLDVTNAIADSALVAALRVSQGLRARLDVLWQRLVEGAAVCEGAQ